MYDIREVVADSQDTTLLGFEYITEIKRYHPAEKEELRPFYECRICYVY